MCRARLLLCTAALLALLPAGVAAAWTILGSGDVSCREWLASRQSNDPILPSREAWVLGFVSGHNASAQADLGRSVDSKGLFVWVDRYCRDNPDLQLAEAALQLAVSLQAGL